MNLHSMESASGLFENAKWTPEKLQRFRICGSFIMFPIFIWNCVFKYDIPPYLYLSSWGVYFTFSHFMLLFFHYMVLGSREYSSKRILYFIMLHISQVAFTCELTINIIYWFFIFPFESQTHSNSVTLLYTICIHFLSLLFITTDQIVSFIKYQKKDVWVQFLVIILYGILNISYSKATNKVIYHAMSWKSGMSFLFGFLGILLFIGAFFLGFWLSKRKLARKGLSNHPVEVILKLTGLNNLD
jgi:hypothetical protein